MYMLAHWLLTRSMRHYLSTGCHSIICVLGDPQLLRTHSLFWIWCARKSLIREQWSSFILLDCWTLFSYTSLPLGGNLSFLSIHFSWWISFFPSPPLFLEMDLSFPICPLFLLDLSLFQLLPLLLEDLLFSFLHLFVGGSLFFSHTSLFLVIFLCAISSICKVEKGKICVVVTEKSYFLFSVTVSQPRHYGISIIMIFHDCDNNSCVLWAVCEHVWYAAASHQSQGWDYYKVKIL